MYCIQQVNIFSLQYLLIWAINQPSIKHISTIHQPSNNHSSGVMGACLSGFWQSFMAYGADFQRVNPQHFLGIPWEYLGHTLRIVFLLIMISHWIREYLFSSTPRLIFINRFFFHGENQGLDHASIILISL